VVISSTLQTTLLAFYFRALCYLVSTAAKVARYRSNFEPTVRSLMCFQEYTPSPAQRTKVRFLHGRFIG
jgi:hypothetical protein